MALFVTAYSKATGAPQRVPAYFVDHPVLGRNLRKTPPTATKKAAAKKTAAKTTAKRTTKKAAAKKTADTTPTPAAGENQE